MIITEETKESTKEEEKCKFCDCTNDVENGLCCCCRESCGKE